MNKLLKSVVNAGLFSAWLFFSGFAEAAVTDYSFNGAIDSGSLFGTAYDGNFSFDNAALTQTGIESIALSSFTLHFLSSTYSRADADVPATADFMDGLFLGVSYTYSNGDPAFSLISASGTGLPDDVAYFAYTPLSGEAGFGSLTLTSVPLPAASWLFAGCLGAFSLLRRRIGSQSN